MLYEFHGLPVHVLVVHLAVVAAPLSALLAIAYLIPSWRSWLRWPLLVTTLVAAASIVVARISGENLKQTIAKQLDGTAVGTAVAAHQHYANQLTVAVLIFAVLVVIMLALRSRLSTPAVSFLLPVLCALVGLGVLWCAYLTGEAGAKASWNPNGSVSYSAPT